MLLLLLLLLLLLMEGIDERTACACTDFTLALLLTSSTNQIAAFNDMVMMGIHSERIKLFFSLLGLRRNLALAVCYPCSPEQ